MVIGIHIQKKIKLLTEGIVKMKKNTTYKFIEAKEYSITISNKDQLNELVRLLDNGYRIVLNNSRIFTSSSYFINFIHRYITREFEVLIIKVENHKKKSIWD